MTATPKIASPHQNPVQTTEFPEMKWLSEPAKHDYPAARSYLKLLTGKKTARKIVEKLTGTPCVFFKAKDILRASGLPLLPRSNPDVEKELSRIAAGEALSPCLVVRGRLKKSRPALIVDGYHRICASNHVDENAEIPVHIVGL